MDPVTLIIAASGAWLLLRKKKSAAAGEPGQLQGEPGEVPAEPEGKVGDTPEGFQGGPVKAQDTVTSPGPVAHVTQPAPPPPPTAPKPAAPVGGIAERLGPSLVVSPQEPSPRTVFGTLARTVFLPP